MRFTTLMLLPVFCILCVNANGIITPDYTKYHQSIIRAEEQIFLRRRFDEGLKTYLNTFGQYDFVFLQDCSVAMQIALYVNDEKTFMTVMDKATQNGLMPRHLLKIPYVMKHALYAKNKDAIVNLYKTNRTHYLKRIDTAALKKMYVLFAYDQMEKNHKKNESAARYYARYTPQIKNRMRQLLEFTEKKGWPSDKMLGIDQNDIMAELKIRQPEMIDYYYKKTDHNISKTQLTFDEHYFSSSLIIPIIIHYATLCNNWNHILHPKSFYIEQIRNGNLHPKDLAALYDFPFNFYGSTLVPDPGKGQKYFATGRKSGPALPDKLPDSEINKFRSEFFIAPIESDRAKWQFMADQHMSCGWGWCGQRA